MPALTDFLKDPQACKLYQPRGAAKELFPCRDPEILLCGSAGCVAPETLITLADGSEKTIENLSESENGFTVETLDGAVDCPPSFWKGVADLYRISTVSGRKILVTLDHQVLTRQGWLCVSDLLPGMELLSESPSNVSRSKRTILDYRDGYSADRYLCDEQLRSGLTPDRVFPPSQIDAREYNPSRLADARASKLKRSRPCQVSFRPSNKSCFCRSVESGGRGYSELQCIPEVGQYLFQSFGQFQIGSCLHELNPEFCYDGLGKHRHGHDELSKLRPLCEVPLSFDNKQSQVLCELMSGVSVVDNILRWSEFRTGKDVCIPSYVSPKSHCTVQWDKVQDVSYVRTGDYFDMHVPGVEHYFAQGLIHHNTGKTRAVCEKVIRWLLKCPGSRGLFIRKTRASLTQSVLVTLERDVLPDNPKIYPDMHSQLRQTRSSYRFPNGSELICAGADNPDRIMSTEFDLIAAFEATELLEDDWEKLTTRLRNGRMPFHQAIADCNPGPPSHWLNQRANRPYSIPDALKGVLPPSRVGQKQMTRLNSRHEDNPVLWDSDKMTWTDRGAVYMSKLHSLTGARKLRLLSGLWAASEGLVYPEYDPAIHVLKERFEIPAMWRKIRVIDPGFTNAFSCCWYCFDTDSRMYLYREWYRTQMLVSDHAAKIKELSGDEKYEATIVDPEDAEGRATLSHCGIPNISARNDIETGIETVKLRLRVQADGKPRFFILPDSLVDRDPHLIESKLPIGLEEEIENYVWQPPKPGQMAKEEPLDVANHSLSTLRYASMYRQPTKVNASVFTLPAGHVYQPPARNVNNFTGLKNPPKTFPV